MAHSIRHIASTTAFAALLLTAVAGFAATPAVHVTPQLQSSDIHVHSLRQGVLSYFDDQRHLQVQPLANFVQLRFAGPRREPDAAVGAIELIDGQALVGRFAGSDEQGEHLQWEHPYLGIVAVPLEQVAAVSFRGPLPPRREAAGTDELVLANGDRVQGLVDAITAEGVRLRPAEGRSMLLPLGNLVRIHLANPPRQPSEQHLVWFDDGSRLRAGDLGIVNGRISLLEAALRVPEPIEVELHHLRRIDIAAPRRRLIDLASIQWQLESGAEVFGVRTEPRLDGSTLRLHAPITLRFELPPGAARFAAVLELDDGPNFSPAELAWADFTVIFRDDQQPLAEQRISHTHRSVAVNFELTSPTLLIELDPAVNGPIMDRLRIRDAMILLLGE